MHNIFTSVFKGSIIGVLAKITNAFGVFFVIPLLLNYLGKEKFGIWVMVTSSTAFFSLLDFGIGNNLMMYIAGNYLDLGKIRQRVTDSIFIQLILIFLFIVLVVISTEFLSLKSILNIQSFDSDLKYGILISFVLFMLNIPLSIVYYTQRGFQQGHIANYFQLFSGVITLITQVLVILYVPCFVMLSLAVFGTPLVVSLINTTWYFNKMKLNFINKSPVKLQAIKYLFKENSKLFFLQIFGLLAFNTDVLILAHYTDYKNVAQFSIISKLFAIPTILLGVYWDMLWPVYSRFAADEDWFSIRLVFRRSFIGTVVFVILFLIILFLAKNVILHFWIHEEGFISWPIFLCFGIWIILSNMDGCLALLLNSLQFFRIQLILGVIMVVANLFLSVIFVKKSHLVGVVWGSVISTLLFSFLPLFIYAHQLIRKKTY